MNSSKPIENKKLHFISTDIINALWQGHNWAKKENKIKAQNCAQLFRQSENPFSTC